MYDNGVEPGVAKHDFERAFGSGVFAEDSANEFANFADHGSKRAVTRLYL
jgi:hypothetical protein